MMSRPRKDEFAAKTKLLAHKRSGGKCESAACGHSMLRPGKFHYDHVRMARRDKIYSR